MEKGHIEIGEVLVIALLIVGLSAAVFLFASLSPATPKTPLAGDSSGPETRETATAPPAPNETSASTAQPAVPEDNASVSAAIVNATTGAILEGRLAEADSRFYSDVESGQYEISTYVWAMGKQNDTPDSIPLAKNDLRALDVRFNGRYVDGLRGFAYRIYSSADYSKPPVIYGVAVFISGSNPLEGLDSTIEVRYDPHPEGAQILESCKVLSHSESQTPSGTELKVYDLQCRISYGASP